MTPEASHAALREQITRASHPGGIGEGTTAGESLLKVQEGKSHDTAESHLDAICDRLKDDSETATVLWNVRPWNEFHVLHAIYCQKLRQLLSLGFNCTIVLHDVYAENYLRASQRETNIDDSAIESGIQSCIDRFENAGLDPEKTEIILESQLWDAVDTDEFLQSLISLSHITGFSSELSERDDIVPFLVNHLCELYYESIVDCDILLTGGPDVEGIWDSVREREVADFLNGFSPPLVLYYPFLEGIDGAPLGTNARENSISVKHSETEISAKIRDAPTEFLQLLLDCVLLWPDVHGDPTVDVSMNGAAYDTYSNMTAHAAEADIREATIDGACAYFEAVQR